MKNILARIVCAAICSAPLTVNAQSSDIDTSPQRLFQEGERLFQQEAYSAAIAPLQLFVNQCDDKPTNDGMLMEADYMIVCAAYQLNDEVCIEKLHNHLDKFPDTPHSNRITALIASAHFFNEEYDEALAMFNSTQLHLLATDERNDMTYRLAICHLKAGNKSDAAIWLETLRATSSKYADDCTYYIAYIRYTQQRYDEALKGFLSLQVDSKYRELTHYYIAEIYDIKRNYDKAEIVAQNYLSAYPTNKHSAQMHRILGSANYHYNRPLEAMKAFETYLQTTHEEQPRRDALYMMGLSCYMCGVYSQAVTSLSKVTTQDDELSQNAYLHIGLSHLQMLNKSQARMAFEQAAASQASMKIKEQAAYNYALSIHETSYSAFGESVNAFETFLNSFPQSQYIDKVSSHLVDVYMNTRSYEAALSSINRIAQPSGAILEAKQKILFHLGTQHFANTRFAEAVSLLNRSIELGAYNKPVKADALYWRGESYYRLNEMKKAEESFGEYLNIATSGTSDTYALAHYNLAYIAFNAKNYPLAQSRFVRYAQMERDANSSTLADAYNRIGDCYLHSRQFDEAELYYTKAEKMSNTAGDYSLYQLALVAGLQKNYNGKITLLNSLANKYPASPYVVNALYEKGRSYINIKKSQQAIDTFNELLTKYPESAASRKAAAEIGLLYYQNDNYTMAIEAYKRVVTQYPGSEEARLAMRDLKSIYVDTNRVDEFAVLVSEMPGDIKFDASEQDSLTYMAAEKVYMKGDTSSAKQSFARYLQSYPNGTFSLNAHYHLSVIAKEQGDDDAVMLHTGRLLQYPNSPYTQEALIVRSQILFGSKSYAEAMACYKQLKAIATTSQHRQLAATGALRCAALLNDDIETIAAASSLIAESKLTPELKNEALYLRAKAYINQQAYKKATADLEELSLDTRTLYGAEAKYLLALLLYNSNKFDDAEKQILDFIDQSTPHAYWLARSFVLLSDVYVATGRELDARQYLLSLQQNYSANDDIEQMIDERLERLK